MGAAGGGGVSGMGALTQKLLRYAVRTENLVKRYFFQS